MYLNLLFLAKYDDEILFWNPSMRKIISSYSIKGKIFAQNDKFTNKN